MFYSLDPNLEFCLNAGLKRQSDPIGYLIQVKGEFNLFLIHLDSSLDSTSPKIQTKLRELSKVIYIPFKSILDKFQAMESFHLKVEVNTSKDILDELRLISNSIPKVIQKLNESIERCFQLTEGCLLPNLFEAILVEYLSKYLERFTNLMQRLEKRKTAAHSWNIVTQSLSLNQACGDLLLNLEQIDIQISIQFLDKTKHFLSPNDHSKAIQQHHLFLLETNSSAMKALQDFHSVVKQGV